MVTTRTGSTRPSPISQSQPLAQQSSEDSLSQQRAETPTLEERIRAAERKKESLLAQRRLAELEAEISALQGISPVVPVAITPTPLPRQSRSPETRVSRRRSPTLKIKDPKTYSGGAKNFEEYLQDCKLAFFIQPDAYRSQGQKVAWAMQYLEGEPKRAWYAHWQEEMHHRTVSWVEYEDFLRNLISDPINRRLDIAQRIETASQRRGQDVRTFAIYLENLERQRPAVSEQARVDLLFAKLLPEIRATIVTHHQIPPTRELLVTLAETMEKNIEYAGAILALPHRGKGKERETDNQDSSTRTNKRRRSMKGDFSNHKRNDSAPPAKNMRYDSAKQKKDASDIICYKCQQKGHYANACPNTTRDTTSVNQIEVRDASRYQGKGRASK